MLPHTSWPFPPPGLLGTSFPQTVQVSNLGALFSFLSEVSSPFPLMAPITWCKNVD